MSGSRAGAWGLACALLLVATSAPLGASPRGRGLDAITVPGQRVRLHAKFESGGIGPLRRDLRHVAVRFSALGEHPTARTDTDGVAAASVSPTTSGRFAFSATLVDKAPREPEARERATARATLYVISRKRPVAVVDIDGTLSDMAGWQVPLRGAKADAFQDSPAVLRALAKRYQIVYLSARDDAFLRATRAFLARHEFPDGPVLMNDWGLARKDEREQLNPAAHGAFKLRVLRALKERGLRVEIGIGDAKTDAEAYAAAKLTGFIHAPKGGSVGNGCHAFRTYAQLRERLIRDGRMRAAPQPGRRERGGARAR